MSVLIKGMNMPILCELCDLCHLSLDTQGWKMWCKVAKEYAGRIGYVHGRPNWCPLVEVPTPHGRLIDADALMKDIRLHSESYFADDFAHEWVDKQPTVIEAEEGVESNE